MKKARILNLCSLIVNLSVIFFTVGAVSYSFRTDVIVDPIWFGYRGFKSLVFFTNLSNILAALASAVTLCFNFKNVVKDEYAFPKFAVVLKFVATVSLTVTFMTVVFFLAPIFAFSGKGYFTLFSGYNFILHFLTPVLEIASFLFFEKGLGLGFGYTFVGIIPVLLYGAVYIVMVALIGEENGGWADFYGFTFGGKTWVIPFSIAGMLSASYLFSLSLWFFARKTNAKISETK